MTVSVLLWAICNVIKMADVKAVRKHKHMGKQLRNCLCLGVGVEESRVGESIFIFLSNGCFCFAIMRHHVKVS